MFWGFIGLVCCIWICLFVLRFYCFSTYCHFEFKHIFVLYEYLLCMYSCDVVLSNAVAWSPRQVSLQDNKVYLISFYQIRLMVMFSLFQASWGQQICEDIILVISCCVLICQELPDQRGHYMWHVLPWRLPLVSQTGHRGFLLICLISVYLYLYSPFRQQSHHFNDIL